MPCCFPEPDPYSWGYTSIRNWPGEATVQKRLDINRWFRILWRLCGKYSQLSLTNQILVYKMVLRPIWTNGLELWDSAHPSNVNYLQVCQSKILCVIMNAPFYVSIRTLHTNLKIPFVEELALSSYSTFHVSLDSQPNPLIQALFHRTHQDPPKRRWPHVLLL